MQTNAELARLIERFVVEDGTLETPIPRMKLMRLSHPTDPVHSVHDPALGIIVQGRKRVILADRTLIYDPAHYLVASLDLPISGHVLEASPEVPYLGFKLALDPASLSAIMMEAPMIPAARESTGPALGLSAVTPELLDAVIRMVRLLDTPGDIAVLAPLLEREILYRLLMGEQSAHVRQIALADSRLHQVNRAIGWIRRNYARPFRIETLAAEARMSPSTLHQHFKAVTAMSPLQYQKQIRLQEARTLMLSRGMDAASAGHEVGYDSPSQFSREYRRLFGAPPVQDAERLRAEPGLAMGA